jgi:gamma-glutamyltranspeptidase/glutathione hydrolase
MVATSQPLAALAGLDLLKQGGNAADAAVAAAAMHAVVEPLMTGLGGDLFALFYDAATGTVSALNASGRAPAGASVADLRARGLTRMPEFNGQSVSVPGAVAGWNDLLRRHGSMPLTHVIGAAIDMAEHGYPVSDVIAHLWASAAPKLRRDPDWCAANGEPARPQPSGAELLTEGRAPRAGELIRLPELARTLRGVAEQGVDFIYRGEFAARAATHAQRYDGWLTAADFAAHVNTWDTPVSTGYRGIRVYECPPNGQGLAALLALNLARGYDLAAMPAADRAHMLIECMRSGYADAHYWVADPVQARAPIAELLSAGYADRRRAELDPRRARDVVAFGDPRTRSDTVYVSAIDAHGNACSLINSVFRAFGSGLVVPGTGVALQNRASLFDLEPEHPNVLAPGKRPYQTIIPALSVYENGTSTGALHACFGVVGGQMQPQGQLQILVNLIDLGLAPQPALDALRWQLTAIPAGQGKQPVGAAQAGGRVLVEEGWDEEVLAELARRGHRLQTVGGYERVSFGGAQFILRDPDSGVLTGASEPRMDGCAVGY